MICSFINSIIKLKIMKKILLLFLITTYSYSQVKVDKFNIDGTNSLPEQYIVMEFDNPNQLDLLKGIHLWASKQTLDTDISELPNKKGILIIDSFDPLPYGYLFQNKLGRRFAKPINYFYSIEVKDNMVRILVKDIKTSLEGIKSTGIVRNSSNSNIPVKLDSTSLYLDVKLRDLKYAYSLKGVDMMLNIMNHKAISLKNYLETFLEGNIFNDDGIAFKSVENFSLNNINKFFPYQYRFIDVKNSNAKEVFNKIGEFNLNQSRSGENSFMTYYSYLNQEKNYMVIKAYYRIPTNANAFGYNTNLNSFGSTEDYLNLIFFYENDKLYLGIDSFSESTTVFVSETMAPKSFGAQSYVYNIKSIYGYTNSDDELENFIESTSNSKNSIFNNKFGTNIVKLSSTLRKNGKERKFEMEKPITFTKYMNFVFDELNEFIIESSSQSSDW